MGISKYAIGTTLALTAVVVSSATTGYAISALPKDSVGQQQLKAGAVTASKVRPNTFVGASRLAFGRGNASSHNVKTVLKLPRLNTRVSTDGTPSTSPVVVVHLPPVPTFSWVVQQDGEVTFSTKGGKLNVAPVSGNSLSVQIWRSDNPKSFYLHCDFDVTGFTDARPFSCWAVST